jgi:hypothetical protein
MKVIAAKKKMRVANSSKPLWCGICHIRVAPYELALRVMHQIYHPHCLDSLKRRPQDASARDLQTDSFLTHPDQDF